MPETPRPFSVPTWLKAVLALIVAGVAVWAYRHFGGGELLRSALDGIAALGIWGPVLFIVLYIVATVLFIPGSVLTLGAGAVFGVVKGSIIVSIAATLGATAAFLVGRYVARDWVAKKIEGNKTFRSIDKAVADEGWKIVGLTRLAPVFPFTFLNYAFGLTRVSLRDYFFASWIGMLPGTVMYVYLGGVAGAGLKSEGRTTGEWVLLIVGLLATVAVTIYVTRIAWRALNRKIDLPEEQAPDADKESA
ncbi:MAG TPA: hypothetical protein DCY13_23580 [Verrucomicrobiales bacterium]|nr:hypothetical protein [Verrucomicrobiales bacterium]